MRNQKNKKKLSSAAPLKKGPTHTSTPIPQEEGIRTTLRGRGGSGSGSSKKKNEGGILEGISPIREEEKGEESPSRPRTRAQTTSIPRGTYAYLTRTAKNARTPSPQKKMREGTVKGKDPPTPSGRRSASPATSESSSSFFIPPSPRPQKNKRGRGRRRGKGSTFRSIRSPTPSSSTASFSSSWTPSPQKKAQGSRTPSATKQVATRRSSREISLSQKKKEAMGGEPVVRTPPTIPRPQRAPTPSSDASTAIVEPTRESREGEGEGNTKNKKGPVKRKISFPSPANKGTPTTGRRNNRSPSPARKKGRKTNEDALEEEETIPNPNTRSRTRRTVVSSSSSSCSSYSTLFGSPVVKRTKKKAPAPKAKVQSSAPVSSSSSPPRRSKTPPQPQPPDSPIRRHSSQPPTQSQTQSTPEIRTSPRKRLQTSTPSPLQKKSSRTPRTPIRSPSVASSVSSTTPSPVRAFRARVGSKKKTQNKTITPAPSQKKTSKPTSVSRDKQHKDKGTTPTAIPSPQRRVDPSSVRIPVPATILQDQNRRSSSPPSSAASTPPPPPRSITLTSAPPPPSPSHNKYSNWTVVTLYHKTLKNDIGDLSNECGTLYKAMEDMYGLFRQANVLRYIPDESPALILRLTKKEIRDNPSDGNSLLLEGLDFTDDDPEMVQGLGIRIDVSFDGDIQEYLASDKVLKNDDILVIYGNVTIEDEEGVERKVSPVQGERRIVCLTLRDIKPEGFTYRDKPSGVRVKTRGSFLSWVVENKDKDPIGDVVDAEEGDLLQYRQQPYFLIAVPPREYIMMFPHDNDSPRSPLPSPERRKREIEIGRSLSNQSGQDDGAKPIRREQGETQRSTTEVTKEEPLRGTRRRRDQTPERPRSRNQSQPQQEPPSSEEWPSIPSILLEDREVPLIRNPFNRQPSPIPPQINFQELERNPDLMNYADWTTVKWFVEGPSRPKVHRVRGAYNYSSLREMKVALAKRTLKQYRKGERPDFILPDEQFFYALVTEVLPEKRVEFPSYHFKVADDTLADVRVRLCTSRADGEMGPQMRVGDVIRVHRACAQIEHVDPRNDDDNEMVLSATPHRNYAIFRHDRINNQIIVDSCAHKISLDRDQATREISELLELARRRQAQPQPSQQNGNAINNSSTHEETVHDDDNVDVDDNALPNPTDDYDDHDNPSSLSPSPSSEPERTPNPNPTPEDEDVNNSVEAEAEEETTTRNISRSYSPVFHTARSSQASLRRQASEPF